MDVLSHADGSAQAVREAAASGSDDSRLALERELDRLNAALEAHANALAQHLNWTLLAQAFLLTAFFVVLVGAWSVPLPGKRALLAAIVAYGAASLVLGYLSLRGSRDRLAPLRQSRRVVEQALERVAARPTVFSREYLLVTGVGAWASRLLPLVILSGWGALTLYTLALPLPTDVRVTAGGDARAEPGPAARRATTTPRKSEQAAAVAPVAPVAPSPETATADGDSGLAALFRRALNAPPAEAVDAEKP